MRTDDWYIRISPDLDRNGRSRTKLTGEGPSGTKVQGHNNNIELVTESIPRCLFGTNGKLIRTPQDLTNGLAALDSLLDQISTPIYPLIEYTRVDLVLHFRCNVQKFLSAHRHARHPSIRNETVEYDGSGITLPGSKAAIRLYDKQLEMTGKPGNILRLEIQLRKPKLGELFGKSGFEPLNHLDFWQCYQVYRSLVCNLQPEPLPEKLDFNRLLAETEAAGFRLSNGLTAMETYRATVDKETYMARRRQIKGMVLSATSINWERLLPPFLLPEDLPDVET
jgi:hypothetical protein